MIEINMDKINKDSAIIMLSSLIQNGRCDRICIFESGEESDRKPVTYRKDVYEILKEIGIPFHILGFKYIQDAVLIVKKDPYKMNKFTWIVYQEIADKYESSPNRVERAIRHAIEKAFTNGNYEEINKYFGNSYGKDKGKPTNKEFIAMLIELIKEDIDEN